MSVARKSSGDESEYHIVGVRIHVTGEGNLQMAFKGIDDNPSQTLVPLPMTPTSGRIAAPTRLANFQSQRSSFEGTTTEIDEYFVIHKIIIFAKAVAVEYPM